MPKAWPAVASALNAQLGWGAEADSCVHTVIREFIFQATHFHGLHREVRWMRTNQLSRKCYKFPIDSAHVGLSRFRVERRWNLDLA